MATSIVLQPEKEVKPVYIYALIDPFTNLIRYVGKSENVEKRFNSHMGEARRGNKDHKNRWVYSLIKLNSAPVIRILETCGADWKERETWWIKKMREDGCNLTNSKLGGDGYEPSEETRQKMRDAKKGKPGPRTGHVFSEETRKKQSIAAKNRYNRMTEEEKKIFTGRLDGLQKGTSSGWHHTTEAKEKIAAAGRGNTYTRGRKRSKEEVRRQSESRMGHVVSAETRKKIGEAHKRGWANGTISATEEAKRKRAETRRMNIEKRRNCKNPKG